MTQRPTLAQLSDDGRFVGRHIGPRPADRTSMLAALGYDDVEQLLDALVPADIRLDRVLDLPAARSEEGALAEIRRHAEANRTMTSLIGMGYADTHTPGVILRNVLENPAWYTAYTPYQPEISQGRLEALLNFQTMVSDLCGMDIANASMLDEGTAAAEAMTMARRATKHEANAFFVDADCHPQTIDVVVTRAEPLGIEVVVGDPASDLDPSAVFGALLAYPGSSGEVRDLSDVAAAVHDAGGFVSVATDLLALTLLTPPGEWGADAVVGSAQRFGVPMGFGGPHAGFLACRDATRRSLPGRLVGVSLDAGGRPAYRLALQTREQHIRREKATSNICTAQVLLAVIASMYAVYHGPDGLRRIATRVHRLTGALATGLRAAGVEVVTDHFFDTITVSFPGRADEIIAAAVERGLNLRRVDESRVGISLDETTTPEVVAAVLGALGADGDVETWDAAAPEAIPTALSRTSAYLTHEVFWRHRSETELLRYLRELADRDVALDRSMIPLGSCTMKLNATAEMIPVTWPGLGSLHPFAPADQTDGYVALFDELEAWLCEITGYDRISLQPNAGSQGEYAGLLAIRAYHRSRGEAGRDVCLIPASTHGTNAASAVMAGMRVVVVACDDAGNVDVDDLRAKADEHATDLAALMVTYPSTHGVFEEAIREICDQVHSHGGQVYLDGANMNALVGVTRPGDFGADVGHLNLHKTFCIPHGGGGPGVGPVGVREHLAPFLPNHPLRDAAGPSTGIGRRDLGRTLGLGVDPADLVDVCTMMGPDGLRDATVGAILAANYVARRLEGHYPVLYSGHDGLVAHECILDIRPIEKTTGVTGEDIAKRLIDYGFHTPTMSFPVAGTLMVEPTESEPLGELDRFCDAMIAIRDEIRRVESGEWAAEDSPLRHAPHPAEDLLGDSWDRAYSRDLAAYPIASLRRGKYWVPVSRIDNGYGDRNLMCSCPPIEELAAVPSS